MAVCSNVCVCLRGRRADDASLIIRKVAALATGRWEEEAKLEDMDPIFVFGKGKNAEMLSKKDEASDSPEGKKEEEK